MFSPAVKAEQTRLGSRTSFEDREWKTEITDDMRQFLAVIDTFFLATASADGRPYIQHRGGPPGFLKPIGDAHAGLRRFRRQPAIHHARPSERERPRAHLHPALRHPAGGEVWGRARVIEDDIELMERLVDPSYKARPQRAIAFNVRPGQQLPPATSCRATPKPRSRRRWTG